MAIDLSPLANESRLLFSVPVRPIQGRRFQPTGFPDLGAAVYNAPVDEEHSIPCLLVESPQSMANRLELTIWDSGANELKEFARGLSYVRVLDQEGNYLTSSVEEAHRLNSVYIENSVENNGRGAFKQNLTEAIGYDDKRPINRRTFVDTVFMYDVNSLLHGVFLESVGGRLRIARALSAFIEAEQIEVAASGGVKNDVVQPGTERGSERTAAEGYGNVPFPREEYAARTITAYFNLDLSQIRGYGLDGDAQNLLVLLGLFKISSLLDGDLRLRTACDFIVASNGITAARPAGFELPGADHLQGELTAAIAKCRGRFAGDNGVTTVTYQLRS